MRILLLPLLLVVVGAFAQTAPLNDTGQTLCLDADGNARAECTEANSGDGSLRPRQDGRFGRDAQARAGVLTKVGSGAAGFDFTKVCNSGDAAGTGDCPVDPTLGAGSNDWACTRDNVTGLIWEVKTADNSGDAHNFADASAVHASLINTNQLCGFDDWRVPNRRELLSLVHHGAESNPRIDTTFFPNSAGGSSQYWSSEIFAPPGPGSAWLVVFGNGQAGFDFRTLPKAVRLVRGGNLSDGLQRSQLAVFIDNGDGTLTDPMTGLMWDRCAWGQVWNGVDDCTGSAVTRTWQAALAVAVTANKSEYLGYDDWRLPNRIELDSLVEITTFSPAIDSEAFPDTPPASFWSSTVYTANPMLLAWRTTFDNGGSTFQSQSSDFYLRLVREESSFDVLSYRIFQDRFASGQSRNRSQTQTSTVVSHKSSRTAVMQTGAVR